MPQDDDKQPKPDDKAPEDKKPEDNAPETKPEPKPEDKKPEPAPAPAPQDKAPEPKPQPKPENKAPEPNPDVEDLRAKVAEQEKALAEARAAAREAYLDQLGVKANYRAMVPDENPFSADGKAKLKKWAQEHPEVIERARFDDHTPQVSDFEKEMAKKGSIFVDLDEYRHALRVARGK